MPQIAFGLANYVARPLNYHLQGQWSQGEQATSAWFKPIKTFPERFEAYIADVVALGFSMVDMWQPILDHRWLSDDHLDSAVEILSDHGVKVAGFAGQLGSTPEEFERNCEIAAELDAPLLVGQTPLALSDQREFVVATLQKYGLKWAFENSIQTSAEEIASDAGNDGEGTIGIFADVGWFGTNGMDADITLRLLKRRLIHVHLKDVLRQGDHETCRFGQGVVPIEQCVRTLKDIGYTGALTIEHEPYSFDPTDDIRANLEMLKGWLGE
jgi:sugar phosphate isomerase/epimerase